MSNISYRVISIGTLAAHPLWNERNPVRTGHATTTLITAGESRILVDPSLPATALAARLHERSALRPNQITHVFLTSLDGDRRRCLDAFPAAALLAHEAELQFAHQAVHAQISKAEELNDRALLQQLQQLHHRLEQVQPAPDSIVSGIDLFPLPGVTPGTCGLLLPLPRSTVLICGDAVATVEHLEQGKILPGCFDVEQAQESFREAIEIADMLVPGRDNLALNPLRSPGGA